MAKKKDLKEVNLKLGARKFTRIKDTVRAFWDPSKKPKKGGAPHPKELLCVVDGTRIVTEGKFLKKGEDRLMLDVTEEETGKGWTVECKAGLRPKVEAAKLGGGECIMIKYLGLKDTGKKNHMKEFDLFVESL